MMDMWQFVIMTFGKKILIRDNQTAYEGQGGRYKTDFVNKAM